MPNLAISDLPTTHLGNTLVTGAAGFIGSAVCDYLLLNGCQVVGIDNLNDYYDVSLKQARLDRLKKNAKFEFHAIDIADKTKFSDITNKAQPTTIIHLAAQAGVRYSIDNPDAYISANLVGFGNILEASRTLKTTHLVFASTSSVYGLNTKMPFSEHQNTDHPISLYAATKKANEAMAHAYAHLYAIPMTALRFFTVYGPWMRPDMALYKFAQRMTRGEPIEIYNRGEMVRDFTYIDDIVAGIVGAAFHIASPNLQWDGENPDPATSLAPYRVFNIGNGQPVPLLKYIDLLEAALGIQAQRDYLPMQAGDVPGTFADVAELTEHSGYLPSTPVEIGVKNFADWYKKYHRI